MGKYEKTVSIKTFYLTILRRSELILFIFLPLFLTSYVVTQHILPKSYISRSVLSNGGVISQPVYSSLQMTLLSNEMVSATETALLDANLKHENGSSISADEISSGLTFSTYSTNMVSFTITFGSSDFSIVKAVLTTYLDVALSNTKASYPSLAIYSTATESIKTSNENRYFLVGTVVSAFFAFAIPFLCEYFGDEVYDASDVEHLGGVGLDIEFSRKRG